MPTVHQITLRKNDSKVPKGTTLLIVTSSSADHSTADIVPRALRKAGYADEEFQNILSSIDWDWKTVSDDPAYANKISNELRKYQLPVQSANSTHNTEFSKSKSKKAKTSSGSTGRGYFGMSRWNPICWIIWIILLPFKIVWWILKLVLKVCGIWFLISLFTGKDEY